MSERLETLKKARERMADKAERARLKFIETQILIDAIDRAIEGERSGPAEAA